jgi:4-amino-4-deoxy-L-arabinose transferase-like glycosyltransferase
MILRRLLLALFLLLVLAAGYLWLAWHWSYSSGERAGWVQKFSHKGWVCKTWEGELALVSLPGSAVEKFYFTVHDERVAADINRLIGQRVALHYEQKVGLPTRCFGETRHFVTKVTESRDIPIGPGVVVPTAPGSAAPQAPAPAVPPAPAAADPAASR